MKHWQLSQLLKDTNTHRMRETQNTKDKKEKTNLLGFDTNTKTMKKIKRKQTL